MDPPKPKSPASMAHEPGGTPPTRRADDDDATRSPSTVPPSVEPTVPPNEEGLLGAIPGGQRRASLADDTIPRFPAADPSVDVAHNEAVRSHDAVFASGIPSTTVPGGQLRTSPVDNANRHSTAMGDDASVEAVHNQDVLPDADVRSAFTSNVGGSLANASTADVAVELVRNQAASFSSTPGAARRGSNVHSGHSVPHRASVQVVDDVSASSSLADSLVGPPSVQAMPSLKSSIGLRSAAGVVQQRRASAASDASSFSSALDSFTDTLHNQAVPSATWPNDDRGSSIESAAARHVLVTDDATPPTGRTGHVVQVEQPNDVSSEHVEGSGPPSSASRRASHEALVTIGQPISTIAEAAASLNSLYINRRPPSPSSDHLSKIDHNASHLSISSEPAVPDHPSVVTATSLSDARLRHDVGAAASRLQEAAALLTEAATLLSKASSASPGPAVAHEPSHGPGASDACAPAPSTDVRDAAYTGDHLDVNAAALNGVSRGPLDVQNRSQGQGTPEVKPDPALVAALTTAMGEPTGWAAIEKAMTNYDREEIGGYKEDIDSLLTFTGLYSAVLTAFVIVSYPLLQEDTPGESLQALRVISNQTSTSIPATQASSLPSSSPFQPSSAAIRINVLWFASLVISLATASFAILVKQWLRSYLKFATASPQGQLRVRHFRRAGLEAWKVFGIASTLPLLLQVSLALFFAGLCIFTLDVHPTIGHTTLPLVCAWLFLFTVVTVSPSFTARCPYITPALQGYTYTLRCHIYPVFVTVFMKYICFGAFMGVFLMIFPILYAFMWLEEKYSTSKIMENVYDSIGTVLEYLEGYESSKPAEEAGMINKTQYDLEILASADALQADDRLLGTTIKSALEQSDANWVQLLEFTLQVIGNRIPVVDSETNLEHILSAYRSLSPSVRSVIEEIFRLHAASKATEVDDDSVIFPKDWRTIARWAVCIIFQVNLEDGPEALLPTGEKQKWQAKVLDLAFSLYHMAIIKLDNAEVVDRSVQLVDLQLLSFHKGNVNMEKQLVRKCLTLSFTTICQMLAAAYHTESDVDQLSNVIHSIMNYSNGDFYDLEAIEILKLSLLSVKVMYGKIYDNRDSRPTWSANEAAQWKRNFILLAHRLWYFWPNYDLSQDKQAALQQLARSGWGEIPYPTEDSSQEALPLPDYFYLMLWMAAGEELSQIPSQHPRLLQIARMSSHEQDETRMKGIGMAVAYRINPGVLVPPGTEDVEVQGIRTCAPLQDTPNSIPNDPGVDADELGVSEGLQQEQPTDISVVSHSESRAPSETEVRAADIAMQYSPSYPQPVGGVQPEQAPSLTHKTTHMSEDTAPSPGERLDNSHDGDGHKKPGPAVEPAEATEDTAELEDGVIHQASAEGRAALSVTDSCTMPASLPTSSRDETVQAEAQDGSEVTSDNVRAYPISDCAASPFGDNAMDEDNSQCADDVAAGSSHTIQGSERDEVNSESKEQTAEAEGRAVE